jgi:uncharacterized protein (TIGR03066 family)
MRTTLASVIILACVTGNQASEEKFEAAKLVGKWEEKNAKKGEGRTLEFANDGTFKMVITSGENEVKAEGTYELRGDRLTFTVKVMGQEGQQTITISKLTDDELVGAAEGKESRTFQRVKGKP